MADLPALVERIESALARGSTSEWIARLDAAGVPAGPIHDYRQVFDDPHTHARHMVETVEHPVEGTVRTLGFPVKLSATPALVRRPPPLLGEHTAEVLADVGPGEKR
jgi:formyl-CoA transferase